MGPRHTTGRGQTRSPLEALSTVETTSLFLEPGTIQYICHFPLHEAYGMVGTLTVN